jgi:hypothetical protein
MPCILVRCLSASMKAVVPDRSLRRSLRAEWRLVRGVAFRGNDLFGAGSLRGHPRLPGRLAYEELCRHPEAAYPGRNRTPRLIRVGHGGRSGSGHSHRRRRVAAGCRPSRSPRAGANVTRAHCAGCGTQGAPARWPGDVLARIPPPPSRLGAGVG